MDEMLPNLWLGDLMDAEFYLKDDNPQFVGICVLEGADYRMGNSEQIPIMQTDENGEIYTTFSRLNSVASAISYYLSQGKIVLVYCAAGMERSPLSVAFYISELMGISMDDAYKWIKKLRPIVADRQYWIRRE